MNNKSKKILKAVVCIAIIAALGFGTVSALVFADSTVTQTEASSTTTTDDEFRGVWVSCYSYSSIGLSSNLSKEDFKAKYKKFLKKMQAYNINAIVFHVRAFDDAIWESDTFNASAYMAGSANKNKKASSVYSYDPLKVLITLTHKYGMEFHAWMNPYRTVEASYYYDPGKLSSRKRVRQAVSEVLEYNVDGIHFDDYFYNATSGYCSVADPGTKYSIIAKSGDSHTQTKYKVVSAEKKKKNVNKLVKSVYKLCHSKGKEFGISPQGNLENDRASGADIDTWLSAAKKNYVDYLVPQLYWTNKWGEDGNVTMFNNRLNEFVKLNKNNTKLYIGLSASRAGEKIKDDPGWKDNTKNLVTQIKKLRKKGAEGFVFFDTSAFYSSNSDKKKELSRVKTLLTQ